MFKLIATCTTAMLLGTTVLAQEAPMTVDQVARPGGTIPGNPEIQLVQVASGFLDPTNVANAGDGSGRIFVTERAGRIKIVDKDGNVQEDPFLDLTAINPLGSDVQTGFVEQGLYSVAFDPKYSENGHFYVHYASLPFNGDGMIVRFTVDPASPDVVSPERTNETAKVIMRIEQPWYNHNGGQIEFGPDGMLYIGSGDGGWEGDPYEAGQDLTTRLGKILRIDVNTEDAPYKIPADNPYAGASSERLMQLFGITEEQFSQIKTRSLPEIWSYGVRNPYEFSFDPKSGDMYIADVGQNHWEEIIYEKAGDGGHNYGWPRMEAAFCHPMIGDPAESECSIVGTLPAAMYPHNTAFPGAPEDTTSAGCSVQGFGVANYGGMDGVYLAGDWCSGRVFGLASDAAGWQFQELMQTGMQFTAGGYDEEDNVLIVNANNFYLADQGPDTNPPGSLWRVMAASDVPEGATLAKQAK
ncbi:Glucose / Sorbosone dehydrogenase [Sulfitobacter brevis]|uniref:Glucose / Sorbosone dehydrogenase n=1 Tax=Sulfitobacter brevis TaxID=74348 RepID=A0A1I2GJK8_9RHOB|nr:PQQ-dependent sugar dehydrogenase [Sulfitobacter brevis]SFF18084.1 Glucose / Sorbosone dehydrogenase [Sulfitobacter brevis]